MAKSRASIFNEGEEIDVSGFAPQAVTPAGPSPAAVKAVSETANFRSREPSAVKRAEKPKRQPRRHRTGRNVQFNAKASHETIEEFYSITEKQKWVLGYTLERAVAALKRELEKP